MLRNSPETRKKPITARRTILARLLVPVFTVMLLQSLLYVVLLWEGGVIRYADQNAYDILAERTAGRRQYLQNEMLSKWSSVHETEHQVLLEIEEALGEWGEDISAISNNAELNTRLIDRLAGDLVYMLRKNMVTGAFLVLDGPGIQNDTSGATRAGYYVRDLDPTNYSTKNADIMVERGMPAISKHMGLAFDACWRPTFTFDNAKDPNARFFFKPLNAARAYGGTESQLFGYWSGAFQLEEKDIRVISYSIPLIYKDGTVIGVLGIDITETYLGSLLNYQEVLPDRAGAYMLGITRDDVVFERVTSNGPLYRAIGTPQTLIMGEAVNADTRRVKLKSEESVQGCVQNLELYSLNTPFYEDRWALVALVEPSALLIFSGEIMRIALIITLAALVIGLISAAVASRRVTKPISSVVEDLKHSDPHKPLALEKLGIKEIDDLTDSIETLSVSVAESSSKISKILSMTQASIGVFEYVEGEDEVFVSSNLFGVLGMPQAMQGESSFIQRAQFDSLLQKLSDKLDHEEEGLYRIEGEEAGPRWVQLTRLVSGARTLGAVSDVTSDVLDKRQIEYERDYDVLTDLYNRRAFQQKLSTLFKSGIHLGYAALIMWDLDNLKYINDTYGHEYGDRYIIALADCLAWYQMRYNAISARRSGDEFYTFIYGFDSLEEGRTAIEEGWSNLKGQKYYLPGDLDYRIRVSAGVAWYPKDANNWQDLSRYADYAMYSVKHTVKGSMQEFDMGGYKSDSSMIYGTEALNKLIDYSLVEYALQPIIVAQTGALYGYEMLMRPKVSEFKTPQDVLRIARVQAKLGHIERISWFNAMGTFVDHVKRGEVEEGTRVFINSIGNQILSEDDFARFEKKFAPYLNRVVLEFIESERGISAYVNRKVQMIASWGGEIALDDYGTAYNSEASLIAITPDLVKLDMSIVRGIDRDENRQDMLRSLITYVDARGIKVIAEGIETEEELRMVVAQGVTYLQGNYICPASFDIQPINQKIGGILKEMREAK